MGTIVDTSKIFYFLCIPMGAVKGLYEYE